MRHSADVLVLGGGMAGATLAAELAGHCDVVVLEAEDQPGRHATGRSAAMFFESYGNATVRALTRASRAFYEQPPAGFADVPLLRARAALIVAEATQLERLEELARSAGTGAGLSRVDAATAIARCPILRPERLAAALLDESGHDVDVGAILQGALRVARRAGARLVTDARDLEVTRSGGVWHVRTRAGDFQAPVLVNAAGAWADAVARQAGVRPVGLQPMRRTALLLPVPPSLGDISAWPMVIGVEEDYYFKPDAGLLLLSPANEDPSEPCDAAPEELEVAVAVDRFEQVTTMPVARIAHRWAGLRSFVADRSPVAGYDDGVDGFFWLAGQGGYGIQMAPGLAAAAAALVLKRDLPAHVSAEGITAQAIAPSRLRTEEGA